MFAAFRIQSRVIGALILRELQARYGRDNLGFLWLMGEPLMFTLGVIAMWRVLRGPYQDNVPVVPLAMFGYLPLLLYRHMVNNSIHHLRFNIALLFHRQVTLFDLYLSRVAMEIAGNILASATTYTVLYELGQVHWPANLGLVYMGYFYNAWWSAACTAMIMPLSERSELVEKFWQPLSYMQLPICGAYIMAQWVPAYWRHWYILWPSVSGYEMMRTGYFGGAMAQYWNQPYVAGWCAALTLVGLAMIRDSSRYLIFE